jgi:hypothetical protein
LTLHGHVHVAVAIKVHDDDHVHVDRAERFTSTRWLTVP